MDQKGRRSYYKEMFFVFLDGRLVQVDNLDALVGFNLCRFQI